MADGQLLRIGEFSRRVGVSPELLRAWENRYGLMRPERSDGGLRLFSVRDEQRVRLMVEHLSSGLAASEAARLALSRSGEAAISPAQAKELAAELARTVAALDEPATQAALDRLFDALTLQRALAEAILPFLHGAGERWVAGETGVAEEHFASNLIGGRLRALASGWGAGVGPRALLACLPGERHDLGLLCFGLVLRELGWRITYLGADTPVADVAAVSAEHEPEIVVLSSVSRRRFAAARAELARLARDVRVAIGGAGATRVLAEQTGAELLDGGAVQAAAALRGAV